jgi:hypothetical protein
MAALLYKDNRIGACCEFFGDNGSTVCATVPYTAANKVAACYIHAIALLVINDTSHILLSHS